jgi:hypothetical protein
LSARAHNHGVTAVITVDPVKRAALEWNGQAIVLAWAVLLTSLRLGLADGFERVGSSGFDVNLPLSSGL